MKKNRTHGVYLHSLHVSTPLTHSIHAPSVRLMGQRPCMAPKGTMRTRPVSGGTGGPAHGNHVLMYKDHALGECGSVRWFRSFIAAFGSLSEMAERNGMSDGTGYMIISGNVILEMGSDDFQCLFLLMLNGIASRFGPCASAFGSWFGPGWRNHERQRERSRGSALLG